MCGLGAPVIATAKLESNADTRLSTHPWQTVWPQLSGMASGTSNVNVTLCWQQQHVGWVAGVTRTLVVAGEELAPSLPCLSGGDTGVSTPCVCAFVRLCLFVLVLACVGCLSSCFFLCVWVVVEHVVVGWSVPASEVVV